MSQKVNILDKKISCLSLNDNINNILNNNNIIFVKDLWVLNRKTLKSFNLSDKEIYNIIVKLQLNGLDLNKRKY